MTAHAPTPRIPYRGLTRRERPIYHDSPLGPWKGEVIVTPITGLRRHGPVFEIVARWTGPGLHDSGLAATAQSISASDVHVVGDLELARAAAIHAAAMLRDARVPHLAAISRALARNRP